MSATNILRHDHEVIQRVLDVMERAARKLEAGQTLSPEILPSAVDFVRVFADGCHHMKEEQNLFPRLRERGMPREDGPVAVMLHEHDLARAYIRELDEAIDRDDRPAMIQAIRGFVDLLRQHIAKENNILFMMADEVLTAEDQASLEEAFERVERDRIGVGVHERYGALVDHLERAIR